MPAHDLMEELGVEVWAFEEGYVRPNFVTFEPHGVNNRSRLPRDPNVYLNAEPTTVPVEREVGNTFWWAALWAIVYYVAAFLLQPAFRRDLHHRPLATREFLPWLISPLRKVKYKFLERGAERRLSGLLSKRYFLVPLQVHVDAQVLVHSRFASVPDFIDAVTASFARSANPTDVLAIKQHPMDRGYHDYSKLIRRLAHKYGVRDRVLYIHDQHLPTLLANARGVVLINSTVGLSALHHGTPLKVMGEALYDIPGLTAQCGLDQFWQEPEKWVRDERLYRSFRAQLVLQTQINGSFYRSGLFQSNSPPAFTLRPDHNAASERPLELKAKGTD
jgi:capsular polysaccharide export protein